MWLKRARLGPRVGKALFLILVDGFLNDGWRDFVAVAGVVITTVGLALALGAAVIAMNSAEAANRAAKEARTALLKNLDIADASSAARLTEEIQGLIHAKQYEYARWRLDELRLLLVRIREAPSQDARTRDEFREYVTLVSSCEDVILTHDTGGGKVDELDLNRTLRKVADFLKQFETRARLDSGGHDADS